MFTDVFGCVFGNGPGVVSITCTPGCDVPPHLCKNWCGGLQHPATGYASTSLTVGKVFLAFLKSSNVSVSPMESMRKPSKLVKSPLLHHATASGLPMPIAAPRQTCTSMLSHDCGNCTFISCRLTRLLTHTGNSVVSTSATLSSCDLGAASGTGKVVSLGALDTTVAVRHRFLHSRAEHVCLH